MKDLKGITGIDEYFSEKNARRFNELEDKARMFNAMYSVNGTLRDNVFSAMEHYARKNFIPFEIVRCPLEGKGVRALTFAKDGVIFLFVNTLIPLNEQIYVAAQGLFELLEYAENLDAPSGWKACWLEKKGFPEKNGLAEETQSSSFAGLLLMPVQAVWNTLAVYGMIDKRLTRKDMLLFMDVFGMPYKECVKRLYECGVITYNAAVDLNWMEDKDVEELASLTGKAKCWLLNGTGMETLGSLLENFKSNAENRYFSAQKAETEKANIQSMIDTYHLNVSLG